MDARLNRRDFLTAGAAFAAAGCASVPSAVGGPAWKPLPSPRRVRVVQWGVTHEHAYGKFLSVKKLPDDFELVGIVDDRDTKTPFEANDFSKYDGVPRLTPEQVFADPSIGCVFVEVTNDDLIPIARRCAEHGLAMHLDKPCGQTFEPYAELMASCRRRGIPVQMGYMFRVNPAIRFCQKAVREGWLGEIISVEADMYHDYGSAAYNGYIASFKGGIMYNLGCHLIDFALPMMKGMPVRAHVIRQDAPGDPAGSGTSCVSVLEWPRGTMTFRTARHAGAQSRWLRIQGTNGRIDLHPIERFDGKPTTLTLALKKPAGGYAKGEHVVDCGVQKDRYADQLKELAEIVRGERKHPDGQYAHDVAVHKATLMACGMP